MTEDEINEQIGDAGCTAAIEWIESEFGNVGSPLLEAANHLLLQVSVAEKMAFIMTAMLGTIAGGAFPKSKLVEFVALIPDDTLN